MTAQQPIACLNCGYDLRAIQSDRCPECGRWFDVTGELTPTLPWAHRRRIGRVRAYWKTVWLLTRRPGRLGEEMGRMVDLAGARTFGRITILVAFLSLAVSGFFARRIWLEHRGAFEGSYEMGDFLALLVMGWSFWITFLVLLLLMAAILSSVSWFVRTRKMDAVRWNRAAALAPYTCAPLALFPLALAMSWALYGLMTWQMGKLLDLRDWHWDVLVGLIPAVLGLIWMGLILRLVKRSRECGIGRLIAIGASILFVWTAMAAVIFVGVHGAATFLILLFYGS